MVTRAKENLQLEVLENYPVKQGGKMVSDELVGLKNEGSQTAYPEIMRPDRGVGRSGRQRAADDVFDQLGLHGTALIGFVQIINRNYIPHKLGLHKGNTSACFLCRKKQCNDRDLSVHRTQALGFWTSSRFIFETRVVGLIRNNAAAPFVP
jgi:hypothetical protein